MSIEFRIKQYDEERCYSNSTIDLKSFLTALYSSEHPYGELMNLDGNKHALILLIMPMTSRVAGKHMISTSTGIE